MYFPEDEVRELFNMLVDASPGAEMLCEVTTLRLVERHKKLDSQRERIVPSQWGVKTGEEIEGFNPKIKFITEWTTSITIKTGEKKAKIRLTRELSGRIVHLKLQS
ncbi:MAG: hypothetical protein ABFC12_04390 [Methanobacterium sp.]